MKVSIVIPVYNEGERLYACLSAILRQSIAAYEVIVVDNNSTDNTRAVVGQFPEVQLISEPKQGVLHARTTGFNAARGDIIGRIDADTVLPPNWVELVQQKFKNSDISAFSGSAHYYDFALARYADTVDAYLRAHLARRLTTNNFLWGANMAVRRSDWLAVRDRLCVQNDIHEDFDLGIHLQQAGKAVRYEQHITAGVSSRRIDSNFSAYFRYSMVGPKTYALHRLKSRRHMYPVLFVCWLAYAPARLIYRSYDAESQRYSATKLFTTTSPRVDPSTNIV